MNNTDKAKLDAAKRMLKGKIELEEVSMMLGIPIEELKLFCDIDPVRLGSWKHEGHFTKAKFVRQKCYLEEIDENINITCAGLPKNCYSQVKWNEFKE